MKFKGLRPFAGGEVVQVFRFLSGTLADFARDLTTGLSKLTFNENFNCYRVDVSLDAVTQGTVPNRFHTGEIDLLFLNYTGAFRFVSATKDQITVENYGGIAATATVLVMQR